MKRKPAVDAEAAVAQIYMHPGFLLRRAHQIAAASLTRECDGGITPPQFSALQLIANVPGIDVIGVARIIGLDRTTGALVVNNLVKSGWVTRKADEADRRRYHLSITASGRAMIERTRPAAERSERQLLSAFSKAEQKQFVALLERFVESFNDDSPAPVGDSALPKTRSRLSRQPR